MEDFLKSKTSLEDLRDSLGAALEVDFQDNQRKLSTHYGTPEPGIRVSMNDIRTAMDRHATGKITTKELSDWAAMLVLNCAYVWDGPEEDEIGSLLDEISLLTLSPRSE